MEHIRKHQQTIVLSLKDADIRWVLRPSLGPRSPPLKVQGSPRCPFFLHPYQPYLTYLRTPCVVSAPCGFAPSLALKPNRTVL